MPGLEDLEFTQWQFQPTGDCRSGLGAALVTPLRDRESALEPSLGSTAERAEFKRS